MKGQTTMIDTGNGTPVKERDCRDRHRTIKYFNVILISLLSIIMGVVGLSLVGQQAISSQYHQACQDIAVERERSDQNKERIMADLSGIKGQVSRIDEKQDRMNNSLQRLLQATSVHEKDR